MMWLTSAEGLGAMRKVATPTPPSRPQRFVSQPARAITLGHWLSNMAGGLVGILRMLARVWTGSIVTSV
jgi:hypothetical protein